jgi:hypothetical protein
VVVSPSSDLDQIDGYLLERSIAQLASLELRRNGVLVWKKTRAQIQEFVPMPGFHLTESAFKKRWLDTFWAWTYQQSASPVADALRIASVLARYSVGVQSVIAAPECMPSGATYTSEPVPAGKPGSDLFEPLSAQLMLAHAEAKQRMAQSPGTRCITAMRPAHVVEPVAVTIDLLPDPVSEVDDTHIWAGEDSMKVRAGVPAIRQVMDQIDAQMPWANIDVSNNEATLMRIDTHVLRQSLAQLAELEVRRGGQVLFTRTSEQMMPMLQPGSAHLSPLQFKREWRDAFSTWAGEEPSGSVGVRVTQALASYLVGVNTVTIGPECGPVSSGYVYGFMTPGVPGDDAPSRLVAEIARTQAAINEQMSTYANTSCLVALRPNPTGNTQPKRVIVELPSDDSVWAADTQVWTEDSAGVRSRAGLPVPEAAPYYRGREAN